MATQLPIVAGATAKAYGSREEWLEARRQGCGASDSAAIVNLSKWASKPSVYGSKVYPPERDEFDIIRAMGHAAEPVIAYCLEEAAGLNLSDPGEFTIYTSKQWPWMFATLDRVTHDGCPVECKTASFDAAKAWQRNVPIDYQIQLQHQMAVTGAPTSYVGVILNSSSFKWFEVPRHERWVNRLVERTGEFWREYVEPKRMPPLDGTDATRRMLERAYPTHSGEVVDLPESFADYGDTWDGLQSAERSAKKERDLLRNELIAAIGEATYARLPDGSGWKFDGKRFTRTEKVRDDEQHAA